MRAMDAYASGLGWAVGRLGVLEALEAVARRGESTGF
jgi:hypothetical protein